MGQSDVFELLAKKRLCGDHNFMSKRDIYNELGRNISTEAVRRSVVHLHRMGYLDYMSPDPFVHRFRLKIKYAKQAKFLNGVEKDG